MLRLKLGEKADADIVSAAAYYRNISPRLAADFRIRLHSAITTIRRRPGVGSLRFAHLYSGNPLRAWSVDHFPYQLLYRVDKGCVHLLRVTHERSLIGPNTVDPMD
jgi:toxin ParE1/3/4